MKEKIKRKAFSEETIQSLKELGEVLLRIHYRLGAEGKVKVKNGKIVIKGQQSNPLKPVID